jgi:hypothetical protein
MIYRGGYNMINSQFPSAYDVEQTIKFYSTQYQDVRRFFQSLGLLNIGNGKDDLSLFAKCLLLEHQDYIVLRQLAQSGSNATNISGFSLRTTLMPKSLQDINEDLVAFRTKLIYQQEQSRKRDAAVQKLQMPELYNGVLSAKFEYQRLIPGRVELIQKVDTEVDFIVELIDKQHWRVICFPKDSQDIKKIETLFMKLGDRSYSPFIISLEAFSQKQRIQFFDSVLDYYSQESEWRFLEVTEISIRREPDKDYIILGEEVDSETEVVDEAGESDLLSITQAVLEGKHLRTNSFVKDCERQGFYFPAMRLLLENRNSPEVIEVTIRFKLSPKMFEVVLTSMSERQDIGQVETSFTYKRQQEILREFWMTCHHIWEEIYEQLPQHKQDQQMSFAEYDKED